MKQGETEDDDTPSRRAGPCHRGLALFDFLMRSAPQLLEAQQSHELTPNHSRALFSLDADGKPIGVLAREWGCDPSTATWLVDRLERSGLADRVALRCPAIGG